MNTFARVAELFGQAFKRNRCIDIIPQQSLTRSKIACQQRIHGLGQKMLTELRVLGSAFHEGGAE